MSANTTSNGFFTHHSTGVEAEVRVDTPTMERLRRAKRERPQGLFLKGPVPVERIARAVGISGRAPALFLAIHFQVDVSGQQWVRLTRDLLRKFGLTRDDKKHWLPRMAEVGLIDINNRGRGRATEVRLRNGPRKRNPTGQDRDVPKLNGPQRVLDRTSDRYAEAPPAFDRFRRPLSTRTIRSSKR